MPPLLLLLLLPCKSDTTAAPAGAVEQPPQHALLRRLHGLMQHVGLRLRLCLRLHHTSTDVGGPRYGVLYIRLLWCWLPLMLLLVVWVVVAGIVVAVMVLVQVQVSDRQAGPCAVPLSAARR